MTPGESPEQVLLARLRATLRSTDETAADIGKLLSRARRRSDQLSERLGRLEDVVAELEKAPTTPSERS